MGDSSPPPSTSSPIYLTTMLPPQVSLGLLGEEAWMLGVEVGMGAGCRLEGHGADGALVENFAV
jgi:hypothetical protein